MNTQFTFLDKSLHLIRYPQRLQHPSWQAWDSADELIIEHLENQPTSYAGTNIVILNDDFGALSCWFDDANITHQTDSFVGQKSCVINREKNQLRTDTIEYIDSLTQVPEHADWILIKIPKSRALLEHQLISLQDKIGPNTQIVAGAKAKLIQKSMLSLFEKYLGETRTSLAKKKSRLIFCSPREVIKPVKNPYPSVWKTDDGNFELTNHANVFSRGQLDLGARLLLEAIPDCNDKKVIDLGCGNGIIGLKVLADYPTSEVIFVDESFMAVESAKLNVLNNLPEAMQRCRFLVSNCLEELDSEERVDMVICNPPFHQQNTITDHIATQMFENSHWHLSTRGELRVIGNRHLDYPQKLKSIFGGYKVIDSDKRFSILLAYK